MDLETNVRQFVAEVTSGMDGGVKSVVLYGSAGSGQHVADRSDLNFLLVADSIGMPLLRSFRSRMGKWSKRGISCPLLVDQDFLIRSTDTYPLEILGMIASKRVLFGPDPLEGLAPKVGDVRVQVEREAKGKELLLRRAYLLSRDDRALERCLVTALPSIEAILRGALYVTGHEWRKNGAELTGEAGRKLGRDLSMLEEIRGIRTGKGRRLRQPEMDTLFEKTLGLVTALADLADRVAEDQ